MWSKRTAHAHLQSTANIHIFIQPLGTTQKQQLPHALRACTHMIKGLDLTWTCSSGGHAIKPFLVQQEWFPQPCEVPNPCINVHTFRS